jgi:hypothetical protein
MAYAYYQRAGKKRVRVMKKIVVKIGQKSTKNSRGRKTMNLANELKRTLLAIGLIYIPILGLILKSEEYMLLPLLVYYVILTNVVIAKQFSKRADEAKLAGEALRIMGVALLSNYLLSSEQKDIALIAGGIFLILGFMPRQVHSMFIVESDDPRYSRYSLILIVSLLIFFVSVLSNSKLVIYLGHDASMAALYLGLISFIVGMVYVGLFLRRSYKECMNDSLEVETGEVGTGESKNSANKEPR